MIKNPNDKIYTEKSLSHLLPVHDFSLNCAPTFYNHVTIFDHNDALEMQPLPGQPHAQ